MRWVERRFVSPLRGSAGFHRCGWRDSVGCHPRLPLCQRYALQSLACDGDFVLQQRDSWWLIRGDGSAGRQTGVSVVLQTLRKTWWRWRYWAVASMRAKVMGGCQALVDGWAVATTGLRRLAGGDSFLWAVGDGRALVDRQGCLS